MRMPKDEEEARSIYAANYQRGQEEGARTERNRILLAIATERYSNDLDALQLSRESWDTIVQIIDGYRRTYCVIDESFDTGDLV